ncbi:cell division protein ZapA [Hylemonella gracilis str. Niagara R]|uniref:Cell division protein ZapA n=1 Tax=Hylemonella gracilis str. Niagara R TaxID=1458275 RepID=A0A016XK51_9BURK|nr:cell division protein ZapA [Hylemonella gracilis]EYC51553.1 cell division protein ZapA [Hylemonella gracilis str. Niagara R]
MKQLEVQIMGQSYLLGAPEGGEERLRQAVQRVDDAMCKIRDAGKIKARERIAVLAALNLAFDLGSNSAAAPLRPAQGEPDSLVSASGLDARDAAAINTLITRLDQALGEDGRLI